jgi:hypothetical protein
MAALTRLGLYGGPRGLYGSFAGKTPGATIGDPVYCEHHAFIDSADLAIVGEIDGSDVVKVAEITNEHAVHAFMNNADIVVTAEISGDDVVLVATIDC